MVPSETMGAETRLGRKDAHVWLIAKAETRREVMSMSLWKGKERYVQKARMANGMFR